MMREKAVQVSYSGNIVKNEMTKIRFLSPKTAPTIYSVVIICRIAICSGSENPPAIFRMIPSTGVQYFAPVFVSRRNFCSKSCILAIGSLAAQIRFFKISLYEVIRVAPVFNFHTTLPPFFESIPQVIIAIYRREKA